MNSGLKDSDSRFLLELSGLSAHSYRFFEMAGDTVLRSTLTHGAEAWVLPADEDRGQHQIDQLPIVFAHEPSCLKSDSNQGEDLLYEQCLPFPFSLFRRSRVPEIDVPSQKDLHHVFRAFGRLESVLRSLRQSILTFAGERTVSLRVERSAHTKGFRVESLEETSFGLSFPLSASRHELLFDVKKSPETAKTQSEHFLRAVEIGLDRLESDALLPASDPLHLLDL